MDLFAKLEQALEGVVEGVFSRAFKAPLQPVEVAKRLSREMESHRTVSVNTTYVPNDYTVYLAPETYEEFQAISGRLRGELEQYLRNVVAERQYATVGAIAVRLAPSESLKGGEMTVVAANDERIQVSTAPATPPPVLRSAPPVAARISTAPATEATTVISPAAAEMYLEVTAGEATGQRFPLATGLTIGRGPTNILILHEPGVSRQHAEIVRQGDAWVVRDLHSTNGTFVNGKRVTAQPLHHGDTITIGTTAITVQ